jgi:hypothetical protein
MTVNRILYVAASLFTLSVAATACTISTGSPAAAPAATASPTTIAPTTSAAPTTPVAATTTTTTTAKPPNYVPVPVYEPGYTLPTYASQVDTTVWGYAPLASYIPNSVYVHTATSLTAPAADQVYVGQSLGVICSVQSTEVTTYGDSTQWDYVVSPKNVYGYVADEFIDVDGPDVPAC